MAVEVADELEGGKLTVVVEMVKPPKFLHITYLPKEPHHHFEYLGYIPCMMPY